MKVRVLVEFHDKKENVIRKVGEEYEVTTERLEEMKVNQEQIGIIFFEEVKGKKTKK